MLRHLAQRRRLERATVGRVLRHYEATFVAELLRLGIPADTEVVELAIGEAVPGMALPAFRLPEEQLVTLLHLLRDSAFIPVVAQRSQGELALKRVCSYPLRCRVPREKKGL